MNEQEQTWLMNKLREFDAAGEYEKAEKVAAILRGAASGSGAAEGPTQEPLREGEVIADGGAEEAQQIAQYRKDEPPPSVEPGVETARPPRDDSLSGRIFRGVEEVLYPGRSTEWVNDALEGGLNRFV